MITQPVVASTTTKNPRLQANADRNRPKKGDSTKVEPVKTTKDISLLRKMLSEHPRNRCIFILGTNTALRASDLLKIRIEHVKYLQVGEVFTVREKKTQKLRSISVNPLAHECIQNLLMSMPNHNDSDYLFQSRKGGGKLCEPTLTALVKQWCATINLRGNYGSHTLRKTWGYIQRTVHKVDIPTLMTIYGHSTQRQTLTYLCIQEAEVQSAYMNQV